MAGVLGPRQNPPGVEAGVFLSRSGDAARYLVVLDDDPYSASAIATVRRLQDRVPEWLAQAGVPARVTALGDTAIAGELASATESDLQRVAVAIIVVELLLLVIFLRSLVAPLVVLAAGAGTVLAAVAATGGLLGRLWGVDSLTFYVPVAVGGLLLGFITDYNVLFVQRVWQLAPGRGVRAAAPVAAREVRPAVSGAGLALAASFGALLTVPIAGVRQAGAALVVGILIEVVLVRPVVLPACFALMGRFMAWPNRRLLRSRAG